MNANAKSSNYTIRGALVVVGGILIHLSIGSYYTFGNFAPYLVSYMRNRTDEVDLRNVDGLWITMFGGLGNSFGMTIGGLLDKRFGPRVATAVGSVLFSASIASTALTIKGTFVAVVATYGVMPAFSSTIVYGPPVQTSIKWFPTHPSLAAGLIVAGFGGGALIFNQVITNYINPDNLKPDLKTDDGERYFTDPELLDRVPYCILILAGCYIGMQLIGLIMIRTPPTTSISSNVENNGISNNAFTELENTVKEENGSLNNEKNTDREIIRKSPKAIETNNVPQSVTEYTVKEAIVKMFKNRNFYVIFATILLLDSAMQFINGLYKAYGQTFIEDDHFLAIVGSMASVFNCIGRPIWGTFMDRFGYRAAMGCITAGLSIVIATLFSTEYTGKAGFFIWICLIYFCQCGTWAVMPATVAKLFGSSNMAINYGFMQLSVTGSHLLGGFFAISLKDLIGFRGLFFLAGGLGVPPFILTFFFNGKDRSGKRI